MRRVGSAITAAVLAALTGVLGFLLGEHMGALQAQRAQPLPAAVIAPVTGSGEAAEVEAVAVAPGLAPAGCAPALAQCREARISLRDSVAELTSEQAELRAELEFYRGLMRADGDSEGLRLHRVEWSALDSERVLLRAVLVRAGPQNRVVEGTLAMRLRGRRGDKVVETPISELLAGPPPAERFRLRHFQEWEAELRLPRGFTPERLIATIDPRGAAPIVKAMPRADLEAER